MIRKNNIILPKWNEKRAKLQEGQIDPLTKTIKNRPFRALAEEYLEEGQLLCYFNIVDFKLFNYRFGFEEGDLSGRADYEDVCGPVCGSFVQCRLL